MEESKKFRFKVSVFFVFAVMLFVLCGAIVVAGLGMVEDIATAFEATNPIVPIESLLTEVQSGDIDTLVTMAGIELTQYEDDSAIKAYLEENVVDDWAKVTHERSGRGKYDLKSGENTVATLVVKPSKTVDDYGFAPYELAEVTMDVEYAPPTTITCPENAEVSVNGVPLDKTAVIESGIINDGFSQLDGMPTSSVYKLEGLLASPTLTVTADEGLLPSLDEVGENEYTVVLKPTEQVIEDVTPFVLDAVMAYSRFISRDETKTKAMSYFLPDTSFYQHLSEYYNGWYVDHIANSFSPIEVDSFYAVDGENLSCEVEFTYHIDMGWKQLEFPSRYRLFITKTADDGYKIVDLHIL